MNQSTEQILLQGLSLMQTGKSAEAEIIFQKVIQECPNIAEPYQLLGLVYAAREDFAKAQECFKQAVRIEPNNPAYNSNYANTLQDTWQIEESLPFYQKAIELKPDFVDAHFNMGNAFRKLQRFSEALNCYEQAKKINPQYIKCYINTAVVYEAMKQVDRAIAEISEALKFAPQSFELLGYLAVMYSIKKDYESSMNCFRKAFETGQADDKFFLNYGTVCIEVNNPAEAAKAFLKSAELSPSKNAVLGRALHQKMLIADWSGVKELNDEIVRRLHLKEDVADPFGYMGYSDSERDLQIAGFTFLDKKFPTLTKDFSTKKYPRHSKIKIAYVSGEFREHANGSLMTGLIECHDKDKFEVIGLDNGDGDDGNLRRRLTASFDEFIDIRKIGDFDLTQQLQSKEIDILFNLNGFFGAHRTGLFSNRSAPIQINFLGCPGTMGVDYMDYLIADNIVIPKSSYEFYNEKIISLPHSYQINDSKRPELKRIITRQECGLPEGAFVFCCFNNIYKITPETFKRWMGVLKRVPNSVMWFYYNFPQGPENLKREAQAMGVDASRLIFSPYIKMADHIERNVLADLFLDSLPYNAHTTASDALWADVPVLTLQGKSFAGRVAASLLHAIEMPELIAYTEQEFENMAVDIATHPEKLAALKLKLSKNRLTAPLFDTKLYTKHFESALIEAYERYQSDLPPAHIEVKP
jgi:predicted O-linked N-acetylglucosamine transferase (SPINDLY family)